LAVVALIFYGTLAVLALWATWHNEDLRWIGWMLVTGFCLSNILFFTAPITVRPGPYILIEILVALAAYCAWGATEYRALIVLVAFNLASIGVNLTFAAGGPNPSPHNIFVFVAATNFCFATECLLALGVGIAHGYRVGRFHRRFHLRRHAPQPNAAREGEA
jgi:hypothetical protein